MTHGTVRIQPGSGVAPHNWIVEQCSNPIHWLAVGGFGLLIFAGLQHIEILLTGLILFLAATALPMLWRNRMMLMVCLAVGIISAIIPIFAPIAIVLMIALYMKRILLVLLHWRPILSGFIAYGSPLPILIIQEAVHSGNLPPVEWGVAAIAGLGAMLCFHSLLLWLYKWSYDIETALALMGILPLLILAFILPFLKLHVGFGAHDMPFDPAHGGIGIDHGFVHVEHGAIGVEHGAIVESGAIGAAHLQSLGHSGHEAVPPPTGYHVVHSHTRTEPDGHVEHIPDYIRSNPDGIVENNLSYQGVHLPPDQDISHSSDSHIEVTNIAPSIGVVGLAATEGTANSNTSDNTIVSLCKKCGSELKVEGKYCYVCGTSTADAPIGLLFHTKPIVVVGVCALFGSLVMLLMADNPRRQAEQIARRGFEENFNSTTAERVSEQRLAERERLQSEEERRSAEEEAMQAEQEADRSELEENEAFHHRNVPAPIQEKQPTITAEEDNDLLLPSRRELTTADLQDKTAWILTLMRNAPYARSGYTFRETKLRDYFEQQTWYSPTTTSMDVASARLSKLELRNCACIMDYQNTHGLREASSLQEP